MLNLDTHILIYALSDNLTSKEKEALRSENEKIKGSAYS
jgi:predicted nucleic acid-binding protein